jgi:hypothetical protein
MVGEPMRQTLLEVQRLPAPASSKLSDQKTVSARPMSAASKSAAHKQKNMFPERFIFYTT